MKASVIGCGSISQHCHMPGYLRASNCELLAGADPGAKQRKRASEIAPGIRLYTRHAKMLAAEQLDVVSVCTPNYLHATHAIAALGAGANVILEKPAALTMAEIRQIEKARRAAGKQVVVGFSHRFMAGPRKAKRLIDSGAIGKPYMIRVRFAHTGPYPGWAQGPWFYDPVKAGGGAMLDMGIHAFDLCNWLIGPVKTVAAQIGTLRKKIKVDDNAVLALEFGDSALGYIEIGWTSPAGYMGIEIMGDGGCIVVDYMKGMTVTSGASSPDMSRKTALRTRTVVRKPMTGGWAIEVPEIVKALGKGENLGLGLDVGGAALAVSLAAYKSASTGKRVRVSP